MSVPNPNSVGLPTFLHERLFVNLRPDLKPEIELSANDSYLRVKGLWVPTQNALTYDVNLLVSSRHPHLELRESSGTLWLPNKELTKRLTDGEVEAIDEQIIPLIQQVAQHEPNQEAQLKLMRDLYDRIGVMIKRNGLINFEQYQLRHQEQKELDELVAQEVIELIPDTNWVEQPCSESSCPASNYEQEESVKPAIAATHGSYQTPRRHKATLVTAALVLLGGLFGASTFGTQTTKPEPETTPVYHNNCPDIGSVLNRLRYPSGSYFATEGQTPLDQLLNPQVEHQARGINYVTIDPNVPTTSTPEPPIPKYHTNPQTPDLGLLPFTKGVVVSDESNTRFPQIRPPLVGPQKNPNNTNPLQEQDYCPQDPMLDDLDLSQGITAKKFY